MLFSDIEREIAEVYHHPDLEAWRILACCAAAHYYAPHGLPPVWLLINGRQGSGKSDMVTSLKYLPTYYALGDVTPKTFFSGFKSGGNEMALMRRIAQPPLLVMKDFGTVLSKNVGSKSEILNQLRMIYDGHHPADTGVGHVAWEGRCTFISVCVPGSFEMDRESFHALGERFMDIVLNPASNDTLNQYLMGRDKEPSKDCIARMMAEYILPLTLPTAPPPPTISPDDIILLSRAISLAGQCRTSIHRDRNTKQIDYVHDCESTSRMTMGIKAIILTSAALENRSQVTTDDIRLGLRIARQSIPRDRYKALKALWPGGDEMDPRWNYTTRWHMPITARNKILDELVSVGVVVRDGSRLQVSPDYLSEFYPQNPLEST